MTNFASNQQSVANALNQLLASQSPQSDQSNTSINTILSQSGRSGGTVTIPIAQGLVQGLVSSSQTPVSVLSSQSSGTVLSVAALPRNQNQKILAAAIIPSNQVNQQRKISPAFHQALKQQLIFRHSQPRQHQAQQVVPCMYHHSISI